jgi:hypothetical protein
VVSCTIWSFVMISPVSFIDLDLTPPAPLPETGRGVGGLGCHFAWPTKCERLILKSER